MTDRTNQIDEAAAAVLAQLEAARRALPALQACEGEGPEDLLPGTAEDVASALESVTRILLPRIFGG